MTEAPDIAAQFEKHLNSPKQTWLLGAGVSFGANIPLMTPLTTRVLDSTESQLYPNDAIALSALDFLKTDVSDEANIEDILTHLGDCISIAERSRNDSIKIGEYVFDRSKLVEIHLALLDKIAETVRWGYKPPVLDEAGEIVHPESIGIRGDPIVDIKGHADFIAAVFGSNRAGVEYLRTPVEFFTTNYDTLLEDALALNQITYRDGFIGGGVGFWRIENYREGERTRAIVTKLHGSIDWYRPGIYPSPLLRIRDDNLYPKREGGAVMIYPQATKYLNTQRDPFAELFQRFRHRLAVGTDHVLLICGYSFGDEHINAEIEQAMASSKSQLTILAFSDEPANKLPKTLSEWRRNRSWRKRVFVASPKGLYQGDEGPHFGIENQPRDWWTFTGATRLFSSGLPADVQEAIQ
tara:strand:- start:2743 stop:3969 length:1227 start_codon:yes stop_codon:yes gene_type:complete